MLTLLLLATLCSAVLVRLFTLPPAPFYFRPLPGTKCRSCSGSRRVQTAQWVDGGRLLLEYWLPCPECHGCGRTRDGRPLLPVPYRDPDPHYRPVPARPLPPRPPLAERIGERLRGR